MNWFYIKLFLLISSSNAFYQPKTALIWKNDLTKPHPFQLKAASLLQEGHQNEEYITSSLSDLFPTLSESLDHLGYKIPTPIQVASAKRALDGENLLLIAPTGTIYVAIFSQAHHMIYIGLNFLE